MAAGKARSVTVLALAAVLSMSLWFVSAAILPEIVAEAGIGPGRAAALSSAVQIGFVIGALALAVHGTADRYDPRRVMLISALIAAGANLALLVTPLGGWAQVVLRAVTGAGLAGVYPVGMKVLVGWGTRDRGALVGLFVGAVTVGSALPHLLAYFGGPDWRATVVAASAMAVAGGSAPPRPGSGRSTPGRRGSIPERCGSPGPTGGCGWRTSGISDTCGSSMPSGPGSASRWRRRSVPRWATGRPRRRGW